MVEVEPRREAEDEVKTTDERECRGRRGRNAVMERARGGDGGIRRGGKLKEGGTERD
jgi:hypothetical protein